MAKFFVVSLLCACALLQVVLAGDLAEALNINIREQLNGYQKFLSEDDGSHKGDLEKLIEITEGALKANTVDEKQSILKNIGQNFTPDFNKWISQKLDEFQVNDDIRQSISLYKGLKAETSQFGAEIDSTIAALEELLKETDPEKKLNSFASLSKGFSPEFQAFLQQNSLPQINQQLQKTKEFFDDLLQQSDLKYETEIKQLKADTEAALGDIAIDEKQNALYQVTNPADRALYDYLQQKYIELH